MAADIIQFPANKIVREVSEFTETLKAESKLKAIEEFCDIMVSAAYTNLVRGGIDESPTFRIKDFPLVADSIRSSIYRHYDIYHPLQDMVDEAIREAQSQLSDETVEEQQEQLPLF